MAAFYSLPGCLLYRSGAFHCDTFNILSCGCTSVLRSRRSFTGCPRFCGASRARPRHTAVLLLSRGIERQRFSELIAYEPQVALRDDRTAEQDVVAEIAVDGTGAGDNLPFDSVPVQHQG